MPHVEGQFRKVALDVRTLLIPTDERLHREGVPQIMDARQFALVVTHASGLEKRCKGAAVRNVGCIKEACADEPRTSSFAAADKSATRPWCSWIAAPGAICGTLTRGCAARCHFPRHRPSSTGEAHPTAGRRYKTARRQGASPPVSAAS